MSDSAETVRDVRRVGGDEMWKLFYGRGFNDHWKSWGPRQRAQCSDAQSYGLTYSRWGAQHGDEFWRQGKRLYTSERWSADRDGVGYVYHASAGELALGNQYDRKYLDGLRYNDPDKFLMELTPNPKHNGKCVGLDLSHPPHRKLQQDYQAQVIAVCQAKGLSEHPALFKPLGPSRAEREKQSIVELKQQLAKQARQLAEKNRQVEQLTQQVTSTKDQSKRLEQEKVQSASQCASLQKSIETMKADHAKAIRAVKSDNGTLSLRIKKLTAEKASLQQKVTTLSQQLSDEQKARRLDHAQLTATNKQLHCKLKAALHPRSPWLRIWEGKYTEEGELPQYEPFAAKKDGCAIGFLAKTPKGKLYMAKLGLPDEAHQVSNTLSTQKRNFQRSVISVITEKLAADLYGALGHGVYYVPKHRLARLKIMNQFTTKNALATAVLTQLNTGKAPKDQLTHGVHLMSRWMEAYQDVVSLAVCRQTPRDKGCPFMDCLHAGVVPQYADIEGKTVPIIGLMEIMAVSRLLADTDVLGGGGNNTGYVVERQDGQPVAVRMVKIDAGEAFNFSGETNQFTQTFVPFSATQKLADPKDLQIGNQQPLTIQWKSLLPAQQKSFLATLKRGLDALSNTQLISFLIQRRGEFDRAIHGMQKQGSKKLLVDKLVTPFKAAWKRYRDAQTMPQVYGSDLPLAKSVVTSPVAFCPKTYGAVNCTIEDAIKLSGDTSTAHSAVSI